MTPKAVVTPPSLRIDKWLWHARFCKTRAIAQARAESGVIRLNGHRVEKRSAAVRVGDTLTIPASKDALVVKVLALGVRRGPPAEARMLFEVVET
jgi:ribosome-associated heat shock protein Hsp15